MAENGKSNVFTRGDTDQEKMERFKAGGMIAMGSFLLGGLFTVAWMTFTPRLLGPRGMGLFGPLMGWFWVLASVFALGVPQTICTFVSLHYENDFEHSKRFLIDGNRLLLIIGLIILAATAALGGAAYATGLISLITFATLATLVFSCVMAMMFWGVNSVLNGFQRLELVSVGNLLFPVGQFIGTVTLALGAKAVFHDWRWVVIGAVAGLGVGQLFGVVPALLMVGKLGGVRAGDLYNLRRGHGLFKEILKFGGIAAIAMTANAVVQNLTAPIVRIAGLYGMLFGDTEAECLRQIGYFSTALIFAMVAMLLTGVSIALIPAMSEAHGQGRDDLMQDYFNTAMQQSFAILGVFIMLYTLYGGRIIELMNGKEFPAAVMGPLASRMIIGGAAVALLFVLSNLLIGIKKPQAAAVVMALVLAGQIGGIIAFSFAFRSIVWASYGFIIPPLVGSIACLIYLHVSVGLKFPWFAFLEPALCGIPAFLVVRFVMPQPALWHMVMNCVIVVVLYGIPLLLLEKRRVKNKTGLEAGTAAT